MENELKVCARLKHKQIGSFEFLDIQLFDRGMKQKHFTTIYLVMPNASTYKKS